MEKNVELLNNAWYKRDFYQVWKWARIVSGRGIGRKGRQFFVASKGETTVEQWTERLKLVGPSGGCSGVQIDYRQEVEKMVEETRRDQGILNASMADIHLVESSLGKKESFVAL